MPKEVKAASEKEDVSKKFFKLCEGLKLGELVTVPEFRLGDVMSAIELGEPKMDVGVGSRSIKGLSEAVMEGLYVDDFPFQLAVMDATIAMMVAWLEGSALGSTVWTNILLSNVNSIDHQVFQPFAAGINLLVRNIHALINSVGNLDELPEDFSPQVLFMHQKWKPRHDIVQSLKSQSDMLVNVGKTWRISANSKRAEQICDAMSARLEMVYLLLEILALLVPPEIEDPNFYHKIHMGTYVVHEKLYETYNGEENAGLETEPKVSNEVPSSGSSEMKADSPQSNDKEVQADGKDTERLSADDHSCESQFEVEDEEYDDDSETRQFSPNFGFARTLCNRLLKVTKSITETIQLGRRAPQGIDGNYCWLVAFEPKSCVKMIPACFPRSINVLPRQQAASWWHKCAQRILDICNILPNSAQDLNRLIYFAKNFTTDSCILSRSLIQICMFPVDNHILGDDIKTVADPIEVSLKRDFNPEILQRESMVYKDDIAQGLYLTFLNHMSKHTITVYSSLGCNLSRQMDRLVVALEELAQLNYHAGRLEARTDEILLQSKTIAVKESNISYHSVATFVFQQLLSVVQQYFDCGFRLDLYVPYEFPYIYWFIGDVQSRWLRTTIERSIEIQMKTWKTKALSLQTKNPQLLAKRAYEENEMKRRMTAHQFMIVNQFAIGQISQGVIKLTVALTRLGRLKSPPGDENAERLRFERRFEPFQKLGPPLNVTYDDFKRESGIAAMYEEDVNTLIEKARENFDSARTNLEKLDNKHEQDINNLFVDAIWSLKSNLISSQLLQVAKTNVVGCKLLKLDLADRKVEWGFSDSVHHFPCLKIIK